MWASAERGRDALGCLFVEERRRGQGRSGMGGREVGGVLSVFLSSSQPFLFSLLFFSSLGRLLTMG